MRAFLKFLINLALIIGVIWLLMRFTPIGDRVRDIWAKQTGKIVISPNGTGSTTDTVVCETPWWVTIPNRSTIFAYKEPVASSGECVSEVRTCKKGELQGSYMYPSCVSVDSASSGGFSNTWLPGSWIADEWIAIPAEWKSCVTPWGQTIKNGNYIVSYQSPSSCTFQRRMCVDGNLMGQFQYNYCILPYYASTQWTTATIGNPDTTRSDSPYSVWWSWQYAQVYYNGTNANTELPTDLRNQNQKGNVAVVSTSNVPTKQTVIYATPDDTSSTAHNDLTQRACTTPWGTKVAHGNYVIAYRTTNPANGRTCEYERRACNYWKLDGSFTASTCTANGESYNSSSWQRGNYGYDKPDQNLRRSCALPWGGYIADGSYITAYRSSTSSIANGCQWQYRFCRDGVLDGSYTNKSCTIVNNYTNKSCILPWGWSIAHGYSVTAYANPSSPCHRETRTCNNGYLGGSYTYSYCENYQPPVDNPDPYVPPVTTPADTYWQRENVGWLDNIPNNLDTCGANATSEYTCASNAVLTCVDYRKVEDDCCISGRAKYEKRTVTCVK